MIILLFLLFCLNNKFFYFINRNEIVNYSIKILLFFEFILLVELIFIFFNDFTIIGIFLLLKIPRIL